MADDRPYASLSLDELTLFANSIAETLAALDDDSQFHSRVGVDQATARRICQALSDELARRERADPDAYYGRSTSDRRSMD